jgi:hypothetical protein
MYLTNYSGALPFRCIATGRTSAAPLELLQRSAIAPGPDRVWPQWPTVPLAVNKFSLPFTELALLVVRPKVGAWQGYAAKQSARDENRGTTKQLQVDLTASIQPLVTRARMRS